MHKRGSAGRVYERERERETCGERCAGASTLCLFLRGVSFFKALQVELRHSPLLFHFPSLLQTSRVSHFSSRLILLTEKSSGSWPFPSLTMYSLHSLLWLEPLPRLGYRVSYSSIASWQVSILNFPRLEKEFESRATFRHEHKVPVFSKSA